jgi:serine kinase of HPr protein (carbohydrate metabolism regulator)
VIFCGDAGHGKSTTAVALALRGIPVIGEDAVPMELTDKKILVTPG